MTQSILEPLSPEDFADQFLRREFPTADRNGATGRLDASQWAMAIKILSAFTTAGFPTRVAVAAVVNAYAESRLRPSLVAGEPRGGVSVGLFQLYDGGAGHGMSIAARQDPNRNIARLIEAEMAPLTTRVDQGTDTPAQASWAFCYYVERPDHATVKANTRQSMARAMFPDIADAFPEEVPEIAA